MPDPLSRDTFTGPWAGLPVAWRPDGAFDEPTYRADVRACCQVGIPGVYTGGTTGEFYAVEIDEFARISRATVETCHEHNTPAMIGCSATSTRGVERRVEIAREVEADAIQVTLPFWIELPDAEVTPFFRSVAKAAGDLPISVYDTLRCKKRLTVAQHQEIHQAVPTYLMVKSNAGTVGDTPEGCAALSEFANVFVPEVRWQELVPHGAAGACSAMVYWRPELVLGLWQWMRSGDALRATPLLKKTKSFHDFLFAQFGPRGFTDTAYDRLVGTAVGILETSLPCRGPYPHANAADQDTVRAWCSENFPELLRFSTAS